MIGFISGKVIAIDQNQLLIKVGEPAGVGYQVFVSERTTQTAKLGENIEIFIHTNVREDALDLFGFLTAWEKKVFLALNQVSGIGPKTAQQILGSLPAEAILTAILRDDRMTLTKAPGIGKKTVERLILELSEKADKLLKERLLDSNTSSLSIAQSYTVVSREQEFGLEAHRVLREATDALVGLGYKEAEVMGTLKKLVTKLEEQSKKVTSETLIRASLQLFAQAQRGQRGLEV